MLLDSRRKWCLLVWARYDTKMCCLFVVRLTLPSLALCSLTLRSLPRIFLLTTPVRGPEGVHEARFAFRRRLVLRLRTTRGRSGKPLRPWGAGVERVSESAVFGQNCNCCKDDQKDMIALCV